MHANSSSGADKGDLTDWLILRFKQLISEGTLTPGYKLPSERELSLHFGVSRTPRLFSPSRWSSFFFWMKHRPRSWWKRG
jgi:hypothetical protein